MTTVRMDINESVFDEIRKSAAVKADLEARAKRIVSAAGSGYVYEVEKTDTRARITIFPDTYEAELDNAKNNTLLRAMDAGR